MSSSTPLLACLLLATAGSAFAASFDCTRAGTLVEQAICSNPELSDLDDAMSNAYREALAQAADAAVVQATQRRWLSEVRNPCRNTGCLRSAYRTRIRELAAVSPAVQPARELRIVGRVRYGTLDSAIETESGRSYGFGSDSAIGARILDTCGDRGVCEVSGFVDADDTLTRVLSVRRLR
ncbi:MAG TPA: lysozyme inhibitor LprI family protein [Plasticicumulans sp.]|uniref:lysozyme inhibitor LprI family protein n=1 Tax=Plasticicumulans sp. TaxID=2307179 RepID=UPI002CC2D7C9|nr:lysozyme inhibitor LprI family protein [Plasticicumulans sp.]HMX54507.1 lysozyme inhibitor LprI family protein [Plasticicumulans sp.]HNB90646.1 lysozyme inhibitor LprI family protein [Plasticicumulans sp.]